MKKRVIPAMVAVWLSRLCPSDVLPPSYDDARYTHPPHNELQAFIFIETSTKKL